MGKFKALKALQCLCENQNQNALVSDLRRFLNKKCWTFKDRQLILNLLAKAIVDPQLRPQVSRLFAPIVRDLLFRVKANFSAKDLLVSLSQLIGHHSCATQFAYHCFQTSVLTPKAIIETSSECDTILEVLIACLSFLNYHTIWFRDAIDWTFVFRFTSHTNPEIRYIAIQCYVILFSLDNQQTSQLFGKCFTQEEWTRLRIENLHLYSQRRPELQIKEQLYYELFASESNDCRQCFEDNDFSEELICVNGVLLNRHNFENKKINGEVVETNVVLVPSTQSNVRSIALAVCSNKPVLVEGPVGCGKTMLIDYLASVTGRHRPPHLVKVQLADQIDSKLLIGSHICTDVPGEFIWKAGPLTQAMQSGSWLVLEDIDCAPSDVISMLASVLESNSLSSLPGCENQLKTVHNDFRIFFTRRLISSENDGPKHTAFFRSSLNYNSLNRLCYKITLDFMTREELSSLISIKWSNLSPISERILDIYYYLQKESLQSVGLKRQVSLRDLMKWCKRMSKHFRLNSDDSAINAFLDANDCFLQSLSDNNQRLAKAEVIGAHLNLNRSQSEYLCSKRKPEFSLKDKLFRIGRVCATNESKFDYSDQKKQFYSFALTHQSLSLLERILVSVDHNEPVLLCGETGTGKTSCVQYLANRLHKSLTVVNMNQQSDSTELLGGYKPIEMKTLMEPLRDEYLKLFSQTFETDKNSAFLEKVNDKFRAQDWSTLFKVMDRVCESASTKCTDIDLLERWAAFRGRIHRLESNKLNEKGCLAFAFIEGSLVKAMKSGHWILLDEINLAETETLQCLSAVLDSPDQSVLLLDKADGLPVVRHPDFRLFACMNPATDVGKKELPIGIRNRFTELFVDELEDKSDLRTLIESYFSHYVTQYGPLVERIVEFYLQVRKDAKQVLTDANGMRPLYSLRTLCRALAVSAPNPCGVFLRSLYESFCLSFLTRLDTNSRIKVETDIIKTVLSKDKLSLLKASIEEPKAKDKYVCVEGFYVLKGMKEPKVNESYIKTATVRKNLKDICRIVSIGKTFPVLLEGETSVGKTSLIEWLAAATGNVCVRLNNHEHTDLQEYVGSYCADQNGKLVFKEGILAEAMRNGYWIILDELNLAPTEVLEALNRVLDDNRELFITETQKLIKADPKFLLFATQNPAGHYGGRKVLSRAFRNRFVELHFDTIPSEELEEILHKRCSLPMSYSKRMVAVLVDLQIRRRDSGVFAGKHGFITLRDLFRWGERYNKFAKQCDSKFYDWDLHLATDGYMLLAGRVRKAEEAGVIQSVLETRFKCKIDVDNLFSDAPLLPENQCIPREFSHIVWNNSFKRLGKLVMEAVKYNEPVLLVGETGCGKTSICQLLAAINGKRLYSVNCHMNTESADFLGSLRPVRHIDANEGLSDKPLFEWVDGPLVDAMKSGDFFLVDEISLADDSVLERLNSVLESERTLVIAENNNTFDNEMSIPVIKANEKFRYFATMNPGGDYGKKELSPALRNRFTEIWCPPYRDMSDVQQIIVHNLDQRLVHHKDNLCQSISDFVQWFNSTVYNSRRVISIRDILSWVQFINVSSHPDRPISLSLKDAFINGGLLVFIDALGMGSFINSDVKTIRLQCERFLENLTSKLYSEECVAKISLDDTKYLSFDVFYVSKGPIKSSESPYNWKSPTVRTNVSRVMRALNLAKPILLEGMPGVGKTSLVQALAKASGHRLIRINLSEQTDISDLFGADFPVEGKDSAGKFAFRDGPLLQALKTDFTWIVLDELNLASQSVLEGLNACLDHRNQVFIPELNKSFKISKNDTRIFATQNPHSEGGARKGLPQSFINRFTNVFMEPFSTEDYMFIISHLFPNIRHSVIKQMVDFNDEVIQQIVVHKRFARRGGPWELNLRELIRWSQVVSHNVSDPDRIRPQRFVKLLYVNKMRTLEDRIEMMKICDKHFDCTLIASHLEFKITDTYLQIGNSLLKRRRNPSFEVKNLNLFNSQKECLESLMKCIEMNWMSILIGDSGVGKTSVVQLLSDLTGHKLTVLSVNPEMDTMDLLGGFEQKDSSHGLVRIEEQVFDLCSQHFQSSSQSVEEILKLWFKYQTLSAGKSSADHSLEKLDTLEEVIRHLQQDNCHIQPYAQELCLQIENMKRDVQDNNHFKGSFEWRDSALVRAITSGHWVLIDNANLCSASVLDRLNPLLEPNGELAINEKGCLDGQVSTIKPHPDFRLILSMDPMNGELSRAMRNRGIEINMFAISDKQDINTQIKSLVKTVDKSSQLSDYFFKRSTDQNGIIDFTQFNQNAKNTIFQIQNGFESELTSKYLTSDCEPSQDGQSSINSSELVLKSDSSSKDMDIYHDLNAMKRDAITSSALRDSVLIESIFNSGNNFSKEIFVGKYSNSLRIYMENSSLEDYPIRHYISKRFPFSEIFSKNSQIMKQIEANLRPVMTKSLESHILKEFQIDLRYSPNIWTLFLELNDCMDTDMELIEKNVNKLAINLFWNHLVSNRKQTTSLDSSCNQSFAEIASDLKNNKISENSFPKVFVPINDLIKTIEEKLIKGSLELSPSNDDFMLLRDILLWIHRLLMVCDRKSSKDYLSKDFIVEKFIVLWILTNEKSLSILQSFLNIDLNLAISSVNQMLKINVSTNDQKKQKLLLSLNKNCLIIKDEDSARLMLSYIKLIETISKSEERLNRNAIKEYSVLIGRNVCQLTSGNYNRLHLEKDISFIKEKLENISNVEMTDETEFDLKAIDRRKTATDFQLEPLHLFFLFLSEVDYLNRKPNHTLKRCLRLIDDKSVCLNPMHISSIVSAVNSNAISSDLILNHLIDFNQYMRVDNILSHLCYDYNQTRRVFELDLFDKSFLRMSFESLPFATLVCSYLLSDKDNSIGLLDSKMSQFSHLKRFLTSNLINGLSDNQMAKTRYQTITDWFSTLVKNISLSSPVKKTSLSANLDSIDRMISRTSNLIAETSSSLDESIVTTLVGLITCHLLCPTFAIDPIERNKCKLDHYLTDSDLISSELSVRSLLSRVQSILLSIEDLDHPLIQELVKRKSNLETKIRKYQSISTFRPKPEEYFKLKSDCIQFLNTILSIKSIESLTKRIIDCSKDNSNRKNCKKLFDEIYNFETSVSAFVTRTQLNYPFHKDLTNPFLIGVALLLKGLKDSTFLLKKQDFIVNQMKFESIADLNSTLNIVTNFYDINSPKFVANYLCDSKTIQKLSKMSDISKTSFEANISCFMRSALLEIQNQMSINYSASLLFDLFRIFSVFVKCWQKLREEEESEKMKEESFFEFRTKTHESELSEEERDKKLLEETFPTYHNLYNDFIDDFNAENSQTINSVELKSDDDIIAQIIDLHMTIVDPLDPNAESVPDFRKSYLLRHSVITKIIKSLGIVLDSQLDRQLIGGQLIALNQTIDDIKSNVLNSSFNIYHNSSLHEINNCFKVLERLEKRITDELLPQFDSHPTLLKLLKIIKTIFDMNAKQPLIKLATGLEVLLQAAQDWQLIAHKGISLADNLNEITQLIISWRKLELKCWSQCLDSVNEKIEAKQRNKFWFHLYITINALIESHCSLDSNHNDIKEFVNSIKKFIENSKLGEFKIRIRLLRSFVFHVLSISPKPSADHLFISLYNLYRFYNQFVLNIENALTSVRQPIEKEVKEFVKIARWNDQNFWSVKTAVDKSHKQLIKYIKKYESELNKPIDSYLIISANQVNPSLPQRQVFTHHLDFRLKAKALNSEPISQLSGYDLLKRSSNLLTKSNILIKKCVKNSAILLNQMNAIEDFNSELILGIKELSELQVSSDIKDKTKWKRSAHHIHNRKRRALSDFFKTLTELGLSYRKGLVVIDSYDSNSILITTGPLDYGSPNVTQVSHQIKEDIDSCDKYFYKGLTRFASLGVSLETPNKQLSIGTIERIKGFSAILMKKVVEKRKTISRNIFDYNRLKTIENNLKHLTTSDLSVIIDGKQFSQLLSSFEDIVVKILSFNYKVIDLLNSLSVCEKEYVLWDDSDVEFEVNPIESKQTIQSINDRLIELNAKLKAIGSDRKHILYCDKDLDILKDINHCLEESMTELIAFYSNRCFTHLSLHSKTSQLLTECLAMTAKLTQFSINYSPNEESSEIVVAVNSEIDSIAKYSSNAIKVILTSIEKVYKLFDKTTEENKESEEILKNSLNSIELEAIFEELAIDKALKAISQLITVMNDDCKNNYSTLRLKAWIVRTVYPFIEVYTKTFNYFLTLSMTSLRTTNKLLHILLSLFCDLTQNGFCLPPELNEETDDKDMGSELKSVEDGGLGEGQGSKDISDKIESEDQLEDAFKEGAEKSDDKDDDRDIEEEENGIEMHNDFDGQTFSPSKAENEENKSSDEDQSDDQLENQMEDVDNNSEVLDEKIWGSDEEDNDSDHSKDEDEDETGFSGKDSIDNKIVANDENKDLNKDNDENPEQHNESDSEINENELQNDEYVDESVDPYKQNEAKEPPKQDFPDNMILDDKDIDQENEEKNDEIDISVSDQNEDNDDNDIENEQNVEDIDMDDEENKENKEDIEENETDSQKCEDSKTDVKEENEEKSDDKENESSNAVNDVKNENNPMANNEIQGSDGTDAALESDTNPQKGSDVMTEEQNESNEEEHGMSRSMAGDNSGQSYGQQVMSSVSLDESEVKREKFDPNSRRDKSRRSLADNYEQNVKRQKVIESEGDCREPDVNRDGPNEPKVSSDLFRHVSNQSEANDQVIDIASNEEKLLQKEEMDNEPKDDIKLDETQSEDMEVDHKSDSNQRLEPIDGITNKRKNETKNRNESNKDTNSEEVMEIDGDLVQTLSVQRGFDSSFHTSLDAVDKDLTQSMDFDKHFDQFLLKSNETSDFESVIDLWKECESRVSPLVYELCQRLQLVLEPTKTAKLKGDYRTGKRLNMRKVIAYIASDFRKDKIWLRRTKASKREYQIVIAIDDSSSMADNKSKQLAFESLALLAKSLSLLEAGQLAVMSFGQTVNLLHAFDQPFTDRTGAHLLTQLTFSQTETRIADLLQTAIRMLASSGRSRSGQSVDISQLLIIVSDGRGVYSEGEAKVKQTIRTMKELSIFTVFVIVDNPLNKDSILDIRVPIFDSCGTVRIESYMQKFPFPFYILLRDIDGLPIVMGEALRQWFELITTGQ